MDETMFSIFSPINTLYQKCRNWIPDDRKNPYFAFAMLIAVCATDNMNNAGTMTSYFSISEKFDTSAATVSWVLSAYALTLGSFIIIMGKFADVFGSEHVFIICGFIMALMGLISAVIEKSIIALIIFRAFQGVAAAGMIPTTFAIVGNIYTGRKLEIALVVVISSLTASFGLGAILGGAFSETNIGYKAYFYFSFALSLVGSTGALLTLPKIPRTEGHKAMKAKDLDYGGCALLVIGFLLLILGLTEGGESWNRPVAYVPIIVGVLVLIVVFSFEMIYVQRYKNFYTEKLKENPEMEINDWRYRIQLLFPREVIRVRNIIPYMFGAFFVLMGFVAVMVTLLDYYLYVSLNSPILAAVKVVPLSGGLVIGALIYRGSYAEKAGVKLCLIFSALVQLTMAIWMSRLDFTIHNSYWKYEFISQILLGMGANWFFNIYVNDIIPSTPLHLQGVVMGILQTGGQIGVCLGNAIVATILGTYTLSEDYEYRKELSDRFVHPFYMVFAVYILYLFCTLAVRTSEPAQATETAANSSDSRDDQEEKESESNIERTTETV